MVDTEATLKKGMNITEPDSKVQNICKQVILDIFSELIFFWAIFAVAFNQLVSEWFLGGCSIKGIGHPTMRII